MTDTLWIRHNHYRSYW